MLQERAYPGSLHLSGTPLQPAQLFWNQTAAPLVEEAIRRHEGLIAESGPIVVRTGPHTGRSPKDKYIVREPSSAERVWWGSTNQSMAPAQFDGIKRRIAAHFQGRDVFVQDLWVGADPLYRLPIRVITELAWQSLFARTMFIPQAAEAAAAPEPEFTIVGAPGFHADPQADGTRSETVIAIHFAERLVLIGGSQYAGEIKKSVFTILNYLLPLRNVLSMHCSANVGHNGDVALFFGLSGTGKTTLSADPERRLIGDDEHGWSEHGVFNFEGGCYAKLIRLSPTAEPQIYATTKLFGTVLENVVIDPVSRRLDLDSDALTENTRGAYPLAFIPNAVPDAMGGHPRNIVFLTADAFGVLPPVSRLTPDQAMYHFLSGYTAKVAGTERGLGKEPEATFSTCFGAPFMALHPGVYAALLGERIARHGARCWLVNTGWSGGPAGVGHRIPLHYTRAMVRAILTGALEEVRTSADPVFGVAVPERCPGVPDHLLNPRGTWPELSAYDAQARNLAQRFRQNFETFAGGVAAPVLAAGPRTE